jgi:hypothetical protein
VTPLLLVLSPAVLALLLLLLLLSPEAALALLVSLLLLLLQTALPLLMSAEARPPATAPAAAGPPGLPAALLSFP